MNDATKQVVDGFYASLGIEKAWRR
jgi:hypothetical protein